LAFCANAELRFEFCYLGWTIWHFRILPEGYRPKRNSTQATDIPDLVAEQLAHFGIDPAAEIGAALSRIATRLYETAGDIDSLWHLTLESIGSLPRTDRIALI